jgi:hypothetical protein
MGVDSTAVLVEFARRGVRPDLITFADTGGEKPETYAYRPVIERFLREHKFPPVTTVLYKVGHGEYSTLEQECVSAGTLPSLAFGFKKCSLKWKIEPQDKYVETWEPAIRAWELGMKVIRTIGYDAGVSDGRRSRLEDTEQYKYWYPLREWGWDRERCKEEIRKAGLPVPPKSACYFCPATRPHELIALTRKHPDLADRIITMERTAQANVVHPLRTTGGLWRKEVKGMRESVAHPASMADFIEDLREHGEEYATRKRFVIRKKR